MLDKIKALLQEVENMKAANAEELEALRIKYLSKKGEISALMNDFRNVAADQKREVGKYLNELKETTQSKINELKDSYGLPDRTRHSSSSITCKERNLRYIRTVRIQHR